MCFACGTANVPDAMQCRACAVPIANVTPSRVVAETGLSKGARRTRTLVIFGLIVGTILVIVVYGVIFLVLFKSPKTYRTGTQLSYATSWPAASAVRAAHGTLASAG